MPYLRMEPDNSLAETLGNLGSSLTQAFNPMNQLRAQSLLQEQQQRAFELQKERQLDAANANAATVYGNLNPHNLSPADLEVAKSQIRNGQFNPAQTMDALTATSNMTARNAAADLYAANNSGMPPDQLASDVADIRSGRKNASELASDRATAVLGVNKATQTLGATNTALTPASKEAFASGQPDVGSKLDAGTRVAATTIDPNDPDAQAKLDKLNADRAAAGYSTLPLGQAPTVTLQPTYDADAAARAAEVARQAEVGKQVGGGITPSGQLFPKGPPGSPGNPLGAPVPDTPIPPAPDVSIANPANPSATPTPITRQTSAGTVVGQTAPEATQSATLDKATRDNLQEAIDAGVSAKKLTNLTARIRELADLAGTGGPEQLPAAIVQRLADMNLRFTKRSEILAEMDSLFKAQIPELRKDMGVRFEAGPELSAQKQMVGASTLPPATLKGILARQDAIANLAIQRRELAQRAIGQNPDNPLLMPDYYREENKIYDQLPAHTQELLKLYGANAAPSAGAPPITQGGAPATPDNGLAAFVHWFTGGGSQAQPAAPAPAGSQELKMIDGKWQ